MPTVKNRERRKRSCGIVGRHLSKTSNQLRKKPITLFYFTTLWGLWGKFTVQSHESRREMEPLPQAAPLLVLTDEPRRRLTTPAIGTASEKVTPAHHINEPLAQNHSQTNPPRHSGMAANAWRYGLCWWSARAGLGESRRRSSDITSWVTPEGRRSWRDQRSRPTEERQQ